MRIILELENQLDKDECQTWLQLCPKGINVEVADNSPENKVQRITNENAPALHSFERLQMKARDINGNWKPNLRMGDYGYRPQFYMFRKTTDKPIGKFLKTIPVGTNSDLFIGLSGITNTVTDKGVMHIPLSLSIRNRTLAQQFVLDNMNDWVTYLYSFRC